jgi:hypothetical protein
MLLSNGSMIKNDVIEAFNAAVTNPENIHEGGGINWNFVDADLNIDLGVIYDTEYLNDCIDVLVNNYYGEAA